MSGSHRSDVDLSNTNDAHTLGILSVPWGARVLDVGTGNGTVARALVERRCRVWGVEVDKALAFEAEPYCEAILVGDVEEIDLDGSWPDAEFDVVLFLDVLEHLRDPAEALRRAASRLAPGGRVVASIPNVAHVAVRLQLLRGRFPYTDQGLLDRGHLRFFDRQEVDQLFHDAGLTVVEQLRVTRSAHETEIDVDIGSFGPEVVAEATADPEAETYQFVVLAAPVAGEGALSLQELLLRRVRELERVNAEAGPYARSLETELARRDERIRHIENTYAEAVADGRAKAAYIAELESVLRERMAELEVIDKEVTHLQRDVALKDDHVRQVRAELASVEAAREAQGVELASLEAAREAQGVELASLEAAREAQGVELERLRNAVADARRLRESAGYRLADLGSIALRRHRVVYAVARRFVRWVVSRRRLEFDA